jgi:hypothetical protein
MSIKTRRTSLRKKEENELIRIINVSSLKTQRVVRIMIVIGEGSTRAWSWWTIYQRRVSGRLGVEVPDVMEKRKWMVESKISIMPWRLTKL